MMQLEPAGEAGGEHDGFRVRRADGREKALLADEPGHLVVFNLVAERAGHAATARVGIDDLGPRDASEEAEERARSDERALVTVRMDEDAPRARAEGHGVGGRGAEDLLESDA